MYSGDVVELLIDIGAIEVRPHNPFVYTSGMRSPLYCDNRLLISSPKERDLVLGQLYALIRKVAGTTWDLVAGVATAGIPFAAWVASEFEKPMVYVREAPKDHGKQHAIEGRVQSGQVAIVTEDLFTTGRSAIGVVETLRSHGVVCDTSFAIFDYEFAKSVDSFKASSVRHFALTGFSRLVQTLRNRGKIEEAEAVLKWHHRENRSV